MTDEDAAPLLPADARVLVLACGHAGHEVLCHGVAAALGGRTQVKRLAPRKLFATFSPWGPVDPADAVEPPWADVTLASGRIAVPYLRAVKRKSGGRAFTVFLHDPRTARGVFDLVWAPEHDRGLRGDNVLQTLTSPHTLSPDVLAAARAAPDLRIAALPAPRMAMVLGGPSKAHSFEPEDMAALVAAARTILAAGYSLMVTGSRRTPRSLLAALAGVLADAPAGRSFLWDGAGANPYAHMLANADAILVTGDSVNMVGEATATGAPVHVYEPSGGAPKITRFLDGLAQHGAARRWRGQVERWTYSPIDATQEVAQAILRRWWGRR